MKGDKEGLKEWAINKIKKDYKDDVSLLIGHDIEKPEDDAKGPFQYYKGSFDYYVPETEKAYNLAKPLYWTESALTYTHEAGSA